MLTIYSDGSCDDSGNGGFGVIINDGHNEHNLMGGSANTTSTQMELQAVITALDYLNKNHPNESATINVDFIAIEQNLNMKDPNMIRVSSEKDKPLWDRIFEQKKENPNVSFNWVKSHADDLQNLKVDRLAKIARKRYEFASKNKSFVYYDYTTENIGNDSLMVKQKGYYMVFDEKSKLKKKGVFDLGETYNDPELLDVKAFNYLLKNMMNQNEVDTKFIFFSHMKHIPMTIKHIQKKKFDINKQKHSFHWKEIKENVDLYDIDVYTRTHRQLGFFNITSDSHDKHQELLSEEIKKSQIKKEVVKNKLKMK